jgi:hypothetical protein
MLSHKKLQFINRWTTDQPSWFNTNRSDNTQVYNDENDIFHSCRLHGLLLIQPAWGQQGGVNRMHFTIFQKIPTKIE